MVVDLSHGRAFHIAIHCNALMSVSASPWWPDESGETVSGLVLSVRRVQAIYVRQITITIRLRLSISRIMASVLW